MRNIRQKQQVKERYKKVGAQLDSEFKTNMKNSLLRFQENLEGFLEKHRKEINENPALRHEFYKLCRELGVDPLACIFYLASKGYWASMLNDVQFYYDLSVQVTTVCIGLRERTGGILDLEDCVKWVNELRGKKNLVDRNDVLKAIDTLQVLGNGIEVIEPTPSCEMILSVPLEFNPDENAVIEKGTEFGYVDYSMFEDWNRKRFEQAVDALISEGILWVDAVDDSYWFPSHSLLTS